MYDLASSSFMVFVADMSFALYQATWFYSLFHDVGALWRAHFVREIRYVRIGMLVEWKKPVWFSDDVDSNGRVSTVNLLVSVESACHLI